MRKHSVILVAVLAAAGLGLAGCHKKPPSPAQQMQHGAQQAAGAAQSAGAQAKQATSDAAITANVKAAFAANAGLSDLNLQVATHNGVVTLSGTVGMISKKDLAARIAHSVSGVTQIVNRIQVKGSGYQ